MLGIVLKPGNRPVEHPNVRVCFLIAKMFLQRLGMGGDFCLTVAGPASQVAMFFCVS